MHVSTWVNPDISHIYTDGSAAESVRDGGAGVLLRFVDGEEELAIPTGKYSTNFRAETEALCAAASAVSGSPARTTGQVVIFTDALSVLQALGNSRNEEMNSLTASLSSLSAAVPSVVLQWVPAHCGLRGNEKADKLAKDGAQKKQEQNLITHSEINSIIKSHCRNTWMLRHPGYNPSDNYYKLGRREQVVIFRLRTGHNRLAHHMHKTFRIGETGDCPCGQGQMNAAHILQSCPSFAEIRVRHWPQPTTAEEKLFGTLDGLRRTAAFIRDTGLDI